MKDTISLVCSISNNDFFHPDTPMESRSMLGNGMRLGLATVVLPTAAVTGLAWHSVHSVSWLLVTPLSQDSKTSRERLELAQSHLGAAGRDLLEGAVFTALSTTAVASLALAALAVFSIGAVPELAALGITAILLSGTGLLKSMHAMDERIRTLNPDRYPNAPKQESKPYTFEFRFNPSSFPRYRAAQPGPQRSERPRTQTRARTFNPYSDLEAQHQLTQQEAIERLGLSTAYTRTDVNSAYRRLALQWHPDKNPDNPEAGTLMRGLQEARSLLLDILARRDAPRD